MKLLLIFAVILFTGVVRSSNDLSHGPVDCAMGSSSCESCHAAYPFCYWCDGKCRQYFGKNFAKLECRGKVMYETCEDNEQTGPDVEEILSMMGSLKKEHKSKPDFTHIGKIVSFGKNARFMITTMTCLGEPWGVVLGSRLAQ